MAYNGYEFKKLSGVEAVETAGNTANVLVEENGEIKKVPKSQFGGGGGVVGALADMPDVVILTTTATTLSANKTFAEILSLILANTVSYAAFCGMGDGYMILPILGLAPLSATGEMVLNDTAEYLMFLIDMNGTQLKFYMQKDGTITPTQPWE